MNFFDKNKSCLVYDGGVYYVSNSDALNPKIISHLEFGDKIKSISYSEDYLSMVFENNKLMSFDSSGKNKMNVKQSARSVNKDLQDDFSFFPLKQFPIFFSFL